MAYQESTEGFAAEGAAPTAEVFSEDPTGRCTGTACRWNDRGFGFIKPQGGGDDVFCHFSAITDGEVLTEGAVVEFDKVYDDRKQKYRAEKVTGGAAQAEDSGFSGARRGGGGGGYQGGGGFSGGSSRGRGVCYDWQAGKCTRGSECRFSHGAEGAEGGEGGDGGGFRRERRSGGGDRSFGGGGSSRGRGVCYDWQAGKCTRGADCRFAHGDAGEGGSGGGGGRGGGDRAARPKGVCYDFQEGRCNRGASCRFAHPDADAGDAAPAGGDEY